MSTVGVNGAILFYEETGAGLPILYIHGMCSFAEIWSDQVQRMGPACRRVTYDRRGHTRSTLGEGIEETVELHADDAAALIKALNLAPCVLVGSSGGARIGLDMVRRYPELVRGAVLSEPPAFALDPKGGDDLVRSVKPSIEAAIARLGPTGAVDGFFDVVCPGLWRAIPDTERDRFRANVREMWADLQSPTYRVSPADLAQIQTPCLIVRGSDTLPVLTHISTILAEHIPHAQLAELQDSGHVTHFEKPAEFAAAVMTFVERL